MRGPVPRNRLTTPLLGGGQAPALRLSGRFLFLRIFRSARACPSQSLGIKKSPFPIRSARACPSQSFDDLVAWRGTGPRPTVIRVALIFRSARACPSQAFDDSDAWRGTGPRPTVIRVSSAFSALFSVARGPVPRNRSTTPMLGGGQAPALRYREKFVAWRGTGPRPTVIRAFIRVSYFSVFSVVRGPVPRDRLTTPTLFPKREERGQYKNCPRSPVTISSPQKGN